MMLAIGTVVLRELDCPTLDMIDHAHLLSTGRYDVHVVCNRTDATISCLTRTTHSRLLLNEVDCILGASGDPFTDVLRSMATAFPASATLFFTVPAMFISLKKVKQQGPLHRLWTFTRYSKSNCHTVVEENEGVEGDWSMTGRREKAK